MNALFRPPATVVNIKRADPADQNSDRILEVEAEGGGVVVIRMTAGDYSRAVAAAGPQPATIMDTQWPVKLSTTT